MSHLAMRIQDLGKSYTLGEVKTMSHHLGLSRLFKNKSPVERETNFRALDNINFDVNSGEVIGIIGHNGAGKSTLLKILSRITEPSKGNATIYGRVGALLEVGTGFHAELSGRDNIFMNGAILGMRRSEIKQHFDEIVEFAGVEKFIDTPMKRYSTGMSVRLAFSVAAHLQPEILIVDEVLAVGDAEFQKKCLGKMGEFGRQGRTVLFVSHNMAAVRELTSRCILLQRGKVVFDGDPSGAIERYSDAVASHFIQGADLEFWPRISPPQDGLVKIKTLSFHRSTPVFRSSEPIKFSIEMRASETVHSVRVGGTIIRTEGIPVGSFCSPETATLSAGETRTFQLQLTEHHLAPGAYKFTLAAGLGNYNSARRDFDIICDVLPFEIASLQGVPGTANIWDPNWGMVHFESINLKDITLKK